jgi:diadenosine tetraphosphate (Ap4A) HIT family hydrolase
VECPICTWSPDDPEYLPVCETRLWRVVLAPNQALIGRSIVCLKRHCGDLAALSPDEVLDWLKIIATMETALRKAFDATMFNWSCYMNNAYREDPPEPHIHWWVVPRYNHPVRLSGLVFEDPHFGNPYEHTRWLDVSQEVRRQIADRLREAIQV